MERIKLAYDAMALGIGLFADSAVQGVERAYAAGLTDEFIVPTVITQPGNRPVENGDGVVFYNFLCGPDAPNYAYIRIAGFYGIRASGKHEKILLVIAMTKYGDEPSIQVLFPQHLITNPLAVRFPSTD